MNEIFTVLIHQPVFNILIVFYRLFGENLGLAIIGIALLSRLVLLPLAVKQMTMLKQNQEFSQKVKEIKEKYKNDKKRQQEETMKIQSEFLPAQLAGCLPLIVQFVLLITINNVFNQLFTEGISAFSKFAYPFVPAFSSEYVLNTSFSGIDLNVHPSAIGFGTSAIIPYIVLIVLVGLTQYFSAKLIQPKKDNSNQEKDGKDRGKGKNESKKKGDKENPAEDFSETLQRTTQQTMFLLPVMIMTASYSLAAGLSLYWVAQSTFVIIQQFLLNKFRKTDRPVSK